MKKQVLSGVLMAILATSFAYADAHKDEKGAKKPKLSTELVAHDEHKKDAKKPKNLEA
ncbi:hypothetical protein [Helicobacter cetorum]|uniref:Secreted protein involved in flagellar motility n=1 Tax=Helicobacter cetorum (strain ATCC BAA-429 / MIT 00-7128) TaxID=182217 RepID=I0EPB2_HELC0|nr:hypothetical protein [Helicobacter cetorum]AFI04781.1 secreted protein involved in flagellar motility [Helicobacter cetorum MIT 00-7128]